MHLALKNNYQTLTIPTFYPVLDKLPHKKIKSKKPITLAPLKNGRSLDYAAETYDIIQRDGFSSLLGRDKQVPSATWLGKAFDWLIGNSTKESLLFEEIEETTITKPSKDDLTCKAIEVKSKEREETKYFTAALRIFRTSSLGYTIDYARCESIADKILDRFSACIKNQLQNANANSLTDRKITIYLLSENQDLDPSFAIDVSGIDESLLESLQGDCGVFALPRKARIVRSDNSNGDNGKIVFVPAPHRNSGNGDVSCPTGCVIAVSVVGGVAAIAVVATIAGIGYCVFCKSK